MPVLHTRQRVDAGLDPCLGQAVHIVFLLPYLRIDIVDADDQPASVFLLHHARLQPHITGLAVDHQAVTDRKDTAAFDVRQRVLFREYRQEAVQVFRIDKLLRSFPRGGKEILSRFSLRESGLVLSRRGKLPVPSGFRIDDVDTDEFTGQRLQAFVGDFFLLGPQGRVALLHLLVDVGDSHDDIAVVILHPRDLHAHIFRTVLPVDAVGQEESSVLIQFPDQRLPVQRLFHHLPVFGINKLVRFVQTFLKEMPPAAHLRQAAGSRVRAVFDIFLRVQVDVVQLRVAPGKRLGQMGVDRACAPCFFVFFFGHGLHTADAVGVRHVLGNPQHAFPPVIVNVFPLGNLDLPDISFGVRHILEEDIRLVHREGHLVVLHIALRRLRVEEFRVRQPDDLIRALFPGKLREGLVAGQVHARPRVLGKAPSGDVVQQGGNGLLQFCDLGGFRQHMLLLAGLPLCLHVQHHQRKDGGDHDVFRAHGGENADSDKAKAV